MSRNDHRVKSIELSPTSPYFYCIDLRTGHQNKGGSFHNHDLNNPVIYCFIMIYHKFV